MRLSPSYPAAPSSETRPKRSFPQTKGVSFSLGLDKGEIREKGAAPSRTPEKSPSRAQALGEPAPLPEACALWDRPQQSAVARRGPGGPALGPLHLSEALRLDAKKSPLALLAQTCSQIGKPDPPPSSKLNSVAAANGLGAEKDPGRSAPGAASASAALKQLGDSPAEDKSSFKPYSKGAGGADSRKDSGSSSVSSTSSSSSASPGDKAGFRVPSASCPPFPPHGAPVSASSSSSSPGGSRGGSPHHSDCKNAGAGGGELGKQDHIGYHGSIVGAYAGYPSQFVPGLDPGKSGLVGGQLSGGLGLPPGKPPSSSPLTGASPPSFLQGLCRDPYCLGGYHSASHLGGSSCSTCSNEPLPHSCNWVAASGPCDKRFATSEELLSHLRAAAAAAAASCHLHLPPPAAPGSPGSLSLRSPHTLGLSRYHPYGKSHLSTAGGLAVPSLPAAGPYYSPYALYGQRLASASALGYQ
ncbi:zinc finger protein 703 [Tupaia chinensis]|uniref:zinc finger protein 703 n=1 Tax=Tupaia chinensis TaxID=246437 RepID=UPI000FFC14E2|nr:zinc finger protein 703 [Tupaia chinensis]